MRKLPLHIKIIIGLVFGVIWALLSSYMGWSSFTVNWIKPFGTIFINLLKLIAVPLVLFSIIKGVSSITDTSKLGRLGAKTLLIYLTTTITAVAIGLFLVNTLEPGKRVAESERIKYRLTYELWALDNGYPIKDGQVLLNDPEYAAYIDTTAAREMQAARMADYSNQVADAASLKGAGPLQFLVDMVPENVFFSLQSNKLMLQVIFFAIFFGLTINFIPANTTQSLRGVIDGVNEVILKMVDLVMQGAPFFVFALLAGQIADMAGDNPSGVIEIFKGLGWYALAVVIGLLFVAFLLYPTLIKLFVKNVGYKAFFRSIGPAQLLAFSSSSSAATLPVTMDCVRENLGVSKNITSFVLPIGATVNMDGTSLYQAIAVVFLAQLHMVDLTVGQQLMIVLTATLASIGAPAVPSAGLVMLIIVLEGVGLNPAWIAIIFPIDRILDMCRTVVNVTGDATVSALVAESEGEINFVKPDKIQNFDV